MLCVIESVNLENKQSASVYKTEILWSTLYCIILRSYLFLFFASVSNIFFSYFDDPHLARVSSHPVCVFPEVSCTTKLLASLTNRLHSSRSYFVMSCACTVIPLNFRSACLSLYRECTSTFFVRITHKHKLYFTISVQKLTTLYN